MICGPKRRGEFNQGWLIFLGSVLIVGGLLALMMWRPAEPEEPLLVYCAAGLRLPVEEAARQYEEEYGVPIRLDFRGSNTLLSTIEVAERGDLYIPADSLYIEQARKKKLLGEALPLAVMTPVIAVAKGNPKGIHSLQDLLDKDVKIVQADPERAAVGKLTQKALEKSGQWEKLKAKTKVFKPTVNDVANDVKLGSGGIDAGIVWDALIPQYPDLEGIPAPELAVEQADIMVGLLASSKRSAAARRFMRYLNASNKGLPVFKKHGFRPVDSEQWVDSVKIYAARDLKTPLNAVAEAYGKDYQQEIYVQLVDADTLAEKAAQDDKADLVVLEGQAAVDAARKQKQIAEAIPLTKGDRPLFVAVAERTVQPTAALHFARFLSSSDRGLPELAKAGQDVVAGDSWADEPKVRALIGAMLLPAIEETIKEFERREGCQVQRVYNGCGILIGQMRAGEHPDAYFSCDASFMTRVNDLFLDSSDVSANELVIITKKDNPKNIQSVKDLARPDIKIGLAHEKQSAMGAITHDLLRKAGIFEQLEDNIVVNTPTGDLLVNQLRAGDKLDAVIACRSNAQKALGAIEVVKLDLPDAVAVQPFAIGKESKHKQLTARLLEALRSTKSKKRFETNGFEWRVK